MIANPDSARSPVHRSWLLAAVAVLFVLIVRSAWVTEDAYITLRTIDNWVHGHGLRWNTGERVQAYTHPLWMLLLSAMYRLTDEAFLTTLALGLACTAAAVWVLTRLSASTAHAFAALVMLSLSRSFTDFSTSGLENPLSHLLLATFYLLYAVRSAGFVWLCLTTAAIALNRIDTALLVVPALGHAAWLELRARGLKPLLVDAALGFAPFVAWELFALFYYGFLVPNTAFAKLNTGIPRGELARQGFLYLVQSLAWDPYPLAVIGIATIATLWRQRMREGLLALGILLYLGYVVRVGGDFMAGRFLTVPMFVAACAIARGALPLERPQALAAVLLPFALLWFHPSATESWPVTNLARTGIADERAYYHDAASLMMMTRTVEQPSFFWKEEGRKLRAQQTPVDVSGNVGFRGFYAGPKVHIVDFNALTDPLLARLPARHNPSWRVGHYTRIVPTGYELTIQTGDCKLRDPNLCAYWEQLSLVVSGPLWSWQRLRAVAAMNLGEYDPLIDVERYRFPEVKQLKLQQISTPIADSAAWDAPGMLRFGNDGVEIDLGAVSRASAIDIRLDGNDELQFTYLLAGEAVASQSSATTPIFRRHVETPEVAQRRGFDRVLIRPVQGDDRYAIGDMRLGPEQPPELAAR